MSWKRLKCIPELQGADDSLWVHHYEQPPSSHVIHSYYKNIDKSHFILEKYADSWKTTNCQAAGSHISRSQGWLTGLSAWLYVQPLHFMCQKCFGTQILSCESWEVWTEHWCFCLLCTFCSLGKSHWLSATILTICQLTGSEDEFMCLAVL